MSITVRLTVVVSPSAMPAVDGCDNDTRAALVDATLFGGHDHRSPMDRRRLRIMGWPEVSFAFRNWSS